MGDPVDCQVFQSGWYDSALPARSLEEPRIFFDHLGGVQREIRLLHQHIDRRVQREASAVTRGEKIDQGIRIETACDTRLDRELRQLRRAKTQDIVERLGDLS